jgi:hypothetical protein
MIITRIIGGIGNQMFQYAAGRALAEQHNVELKLDTRDYRFYTFRNFELNNFNIIAEMASDDEISKYLGRNRTKYLMILKEVLWKKIPLKRNKVYFERHFHFDDKFFQLPDDIHINGYWQSEKYFKIIEPIIRNEYSFKNLPNDANLHILDKIQASNSVSIHIRRGDYVTNKITQFTHGTLDQDYYFNGVNFIAERVNNPIFFVFSDAPEWAKENLKIKYPTIFVDINNVENGFEDMRLLSFCKHHIIANSSFSWWGAWLSSNKDKTVIAPKKWFNKFKADTKDLYPESWIQL